jgi:hypothetical protein
MMAEEGFAAIEKEDIAGLHFPAEDVLRSESDRKNRKAAIDRAISLGNLEHIKVKIYFADDAAQRVVNTTIWAVTDTAVLLKQNVVIPIERIIKLEA